MHTPSDSDEAMLRNPHHPSHTSGGREMAWTFGFFLIGGFILYFAADLTWIPFVPYFVVVGLIGAGLGVVFMRFVAGAGDKKRARLAAEYREMIAVEKQTKIEAMKRVEAMVSPETEPARKGE